MSLLVEIKPGNRGASMAFAPAARTEIHVATPARGGPALLEIRRCVSVFYGVPEAAIASASHEPDVVRPRAIAWFLARRLTRRSLRDIARVMTGHTHCAVTFGERKIEALRQREPVLARELATLERILTGGLHGQA